MTGPDLAPPRLSPLEGIRLRTQRFFRKHGHKLWWLHSCYALALGISVVIIASTGFDHARWLAVSLGVVWLMLLAFFRIFGQGNRQEYATVEKSVRARFLVMTYVLKNLYQGMLFFLLPFYWRSSTLDAPNRYFVVLLGVCAILSTLDVVFDRFLMRWRALAGFFYAVTMFGCLNLVIPAWFPNTRTLYTLMTAGGVTALAFWTMHIPLAALRNRLYIGLLVLSVAAGVTCAYFLRVVIPPVPMSMSHGAVGPMVLPDGRLAMEVRSLDVSVIRQLQAVTDVVVPGGRGDRLHHVWRQEGVEIVRRSDPSTRAAGPRGSIRITSALTERSLPAHLAGRWSVDVETEDGQLVGRVAFTVVE
jgi:hypothetical protein